MFFLFSHILCGIRCAFYVNLNIFDPFHFFCFYCHSILVFNYIFWNVLNSWKSFFGAPELSFRWTIELDCFFGCINVKFWVRKNHLKITESSEMVKIHVFFYLFWEVFWLNHIFLRCRRLEPHFSSFFNVYFAI